MFSRQLTTQFNLLAANIWSATLCVLVGMHFEQAGQSIIKDRNYTPSNRVLEGQRM